MLANLGKTYTKWLALLGLAFFVSGCSDTSETEQIAGQVLGYDYHVEFLPAHPNHTEARVIQRVQGILQYVATQYSVAYPQSEVERFNQWRSTESFVLTRELEGLLRQSLYLHDLSDGEIQMFHSDVHDNRAPVRIYNHQIVKADETVSVNLEGMLQGHMADRIADILDLMNVQTYRISIDNHLRVRSPKRGRGYQRIAFPSLDDFYIDIRDGAVSSGIPEQDSPIEKAIVIHDNAAMAQALAEWFANTPVDKAMAVANANDLSMIVFVREDSGLTRYTSRAFADVVL
ncbi:hypothetical protein FM042_00065 [Aliidiomarina halalkaliphila]|uniref:FAD:protein FMN transferase n=1 Tax=Aliidiomarina halalkaliphila TaxID=2593535 RepID=A0A552X2Q3_9GAMM|nr:FAD:protein FMN transferase [Aliidiomarina halalkaliphila]TRW49308.1 hypothetical protein FM042_00065 [Aliidiomarina halalkaliphila]